MLQLRGLGQTLTKLADRAEKSQSKAKQQIFGRGVSFDKVDMVYPDYDTYFKMSKQEREHHLPQHHSKNRFREFFTEPRFLVRIEELAHFRANEKLKGDILFLHYDGGIITGKKAYAVARARAIEVWDMESEAYPIPNLTLPS